MNKESIEKAKEEIIKIMYSNIDDVDKLELVMNLMKFLNNYEKNIKTLNKRNLLKKWDGYKDEL